MNFVYFLICVSLQFFFPMKRIKTNIYAKCVSFKILSVKDLNWLYITFMQSTFLKKKSTCLVDITWISRTAWLMYRLFCYMMVGLRSPFLWQIGKIENTAYIKKKTKQNLTWLLKSILVLLEWFVSVQFLYRCIFNAHNLALNLLISKIPLIMPWSALKKCCSLPKYTCTFTSLFVKFDRINSVHKAKHATKGQRVFEMLTFIKNTWWSQFKNSYSIGMEATYLFIADGT